MTGRVRLDRIASSARNARLTRSPLIGDEIISREGYVLAVRIINDKTVYNEVEDPSGRFVPLHAGDVLAGTLGSRQALRGYAGVVPEALAAGDVVQVLNLGGVLGLCTADNPDLGPPFDGEVLGSVLSFPPTGDRVGRPAHIRENAVPAAGRLATAVPLVLVAGTCMDAGKTVAAAAIVRGLVRAGLRVAAAKLTGVALLRDTLAMLDAGAAGALTFIDAGVVSTCEREVVPTAYGLLNRLAADYRPDVVVAELGDGVLGEYGVGALLADAELMAQVAALVVCAPDPVAVWGAVRLLDQDYGLRPTAVSGPVTDNEVGSRYVRDALGLVAVNARRQGAALADAVLEQIRG